MLYRNEQQILDIVNDPLEAAPARQVDAVLRAADVLLRVVAQSVIEVEDIVTSPQLRVLVLIHSRGPQNLGGVAAELGVHPSNATRTCERLVVAGLIERRDDPADRRYVRLELTEKGNELVGTVLEHRRQAIAAVIARMAPGRRQSLTAAMEAFAAAAGGEGTVDGRFTLESSP